MGPRKPNDSAVFLSNSFRRAGALRPGTRPRWGQESRMTQLYFCQIHFGEPEHCGLGQDLDGAKKAE